MVSAQADPLQLSLGVVQVSLANWNQDEAWGGFGGPHCMVKGGYSSLMEPLALALNIKHDVIVSQVSYSSEGVTVTSASGQAFPQPIVLSTHLTTKLSYIHKIDYSCLRPEP